MLVRTSLGIVAMLIGILVLAGYVGDRRGNEDVGPVATGEKAPPGLGRFYDQDLTWSRCGASLCTRVRVPVDYDRPSGPSIRLKVKLRPSASGRSAGRVFVNPGGPGGSGVEFVDRFVSLTSKKVLERRDIVGFDPRGVGASSPLECLSPRAFDRVITRDPDPKDAEGAEELARGFRSIGRACVKSSGDLTSHVSTKEVARDLDVLRALMGERRLDYYGASYGTQLGATYAELFPDRAGAMVLDGAVDPTLSAERQGLSQARGFQRALDAYVQSCLDTGDCPLGKDAEEAGETIEDLLDALEDKPIKTRLGRKLTEGSAIHGLAYAMYVPKSWSVLTNGLNRASFGDGTILLALSDQYYGRRQDGTYLDNGPQAYYAVRCLDYPRAPDGAEIGAALPRFDRASAVFGPLMAGFTVACRDWPATSDHRQKGVRADGAAPIVVIGSTRDPATPYPQAKALTRQLDSAVLVTRRGDGHTGYGVGNMCVDRVVERYLAGGAPPHKPVTCAEDM